MFEQVPGLKFSTDGVYEVHNFEQFGRAYAQWQWGKGGMSEPPRDVSLLLRPSCYPCMVVFTEEYDEHFYYIAPEVVWQVAKSMPENPSEPLKARFQPLTTREMSKRRLGRYASESLR